MGFENGKLLRVALRAVDNERREYVNTLHYDLEDVTLGDNDPQDLADRFRDDVVPLFASLFSPLVLVQPVVVTQEKDPLQPNATRGQWTSGAVVTGSKSLGTDALPHAVCMVATLRTAHIGRRYRGRMFIPGTWSESDQNAGNFENPAIALAQAYVDAIPRQPDIAPVGVTATAKWSVYSRTNRGANIDPYANAVTSVVLRREVHWLRSRER